MIKKKLITGLLVATTILGIFTGCGNNNNSNYINYNPDKGSSVSIDFPGGTELEENEDYSITPSTTDLPRLVLHNNKYFEYFFGRDNYSLDELLSIAESNKSIPDFLVPHINDFIEKMYAYYPDLEWRPFAYNLSGVNISLVDENDMNFAMSGALGTYYVDDNSMVLRRDIDLENDELSKNLFRHELGHMLNSCYFNTSEYRVKYKFTLAGGMTTLEAIDVILTTAPFMNEYSDKLKENLGYGLATNIYRIVVEAMDYSLDKSVSNDILYFKAELDKYLPDYITADEFINDLEALRGLRAGDEAVDPSDSDYIAYFKAIAQLYIDTHVTSIGDETEKWAVYDQLIKDLMLGVTDDKAIYFDSMREVFENL